MADLVKMASTGVNEKGEPTGYFKITTKNKKNTPDKMRLKMYDPRAVCPETGKRGIHVEFKEEKVK